MARRYYDVAETINGIFNGTIALENVTGIELYSFGYSLKVYRIYYDRLQHESNEGLRKKLLFDAFVAHNMILSPGSNRL